MSAGFVHDALYFGSDDELVGEAVPFLRDGLTAGDTVAVSGSPRTWLLLRDALGTEQGVVRLPPPDAFERAPAAISALHRFFEAQLAAGARVVRVVGEVPGSTDPQRAAEWIRYEAVIN